MLAANPFSQCHSNSAGSASSYVGSVTISGDGIKFRSRVRVEHSLPARLREKSIADTSSSFSLIDFTLPVPIPDEIDWINDF